MGAMTVRLSKDDMKAIADMVAERLRGMFPTPAEPLKPDDLLNSREVQELLGISSTTFYEWRANGVLPEGVKVGPKLWRWRRGDIMKLLENEKRNP